MTQPVTLKDWPLDFVGPPPPPALPIERTTRDVEALPDPVDQSVMRLAPRPAEGAEPPRDASPTGARLDAFLARATPTFRTPEGWVAVPIGFYMAGSLVKPAGRLPDGIVARAGVSASESSLLQTGRASPEAVARVTQAFIDAGHLPARSDHGSAELPDRVRQLMLDWHLGLDCVGYVAPAALAARGVGRAAAGFQPPGTETLSSLGSHGYTAVPRGAPLRTGDVFALHAMSADDFEHRAVVREAGPASPAEVERIKALWADMPAAARASGSWTKVVVDSSWGNMGQASLGGVQRRTWWQETTTGTWAWSAAGGTFATAGPYGHEKYDVFRLSAAP